ncbi:MAG: hypothetical protein AB8G86_16665 [Saprospiraceae bacterium]
MKAPKSINITQGINPKKLIHLLQNNQVLLLKGKKKTFKIQKDHIQIFQNQVLNIEQIPTQINDIELSDIQKTQLLNDGIINTQKLKITLDKDLLQLKIQKPIHGHEQTQFVNRSRMGGHKIR